MNESLISMMFVRASFVVTARAPSDRIRLIEESLKRKLARSAVIVAAARAKL
jgi:hypothetical protein